VGPRNARKGVGEAPFAGARIRDALLSGETRPASGTCTPERRGPTRASLQRNRERELGLDRRETG
jgi:hypothetical protein